MNVLIFLGGEKPSMKLAQHVARDCALIIAADSGYHAAMDNDVVPHILTGDFDSIGVKNIEGSFEVITAKEQNATDFEKSLRHLPEDISSIQILGGTGLRSDHFLTNLLIASGLRRDLPVVFHDDTQSLYRVTKHCHFKKELAPGTTISLIPFSKCNRVSTEGLHWNLQDADMGPTRQLGQSNRIDNPNVRISVKSGYLYVVVNRPTCS
ncbi:MAG: thiamine diphosphokinase [Puniceicoccaceae bacterium]